MCQYTKFTRKWSAHNAFYQLNREEVKTHAMKYLVMRRATLHIWDVSRMRPHIFGKNSPRRIKMIILKLRRNGLRTLCLNIFNQGKPQHYISNTMHSYQFIEWQLPYASGLLTTFKVNCTRHVASAHLFLQLIRARIKTSSLDCRSLAYYFSYS